MNFADIALRNRTVTLVLTAVMIFGGLNAFQSLSRLEDPEFTIKDALVITPYPGASAYEVENEVSDEMELAVQQLAQLKEVTSKSDRGLSTLTVSIKDQYDRARLPQVWDELRRKVGDAQRNLPPGAGPSLVIDDFGDVYGVFVAVYGPEYNYAELKDFVELLRRELLLVQDVAKIELWGERTEAIYVEPSRERMSQLNVPMEAVMAELRARNLVADAGRVEVGPEFIAIQPGGLFDSVEDFENLRISGGASGSQIRLRDIASVRRGYVEPQAKILRYDGHVAIGLGISTLSGGNVVTMGELVNARAIELRDQWPLGIEVGVVSLQSAAVVTAIEGFTVSLMQAVAIVVVVLLFFMGVRSGLLIGFILFLTITGTFIFLGPMGVALERISLGALIIALGMLVDNAIVVVDGMLVRLQEGQAAEDAAREVVSQTSMPLLGATAVAIMAFAAIGTSDDSTGEYCRSLFQVVLVSLGLSWVTAVTVTPVLCVMFLKAPEGGGGDPYAGRFYAAYSAILRGCIRMRWVTVACVVGLFAVSLYGFGFVDRSFFPDSTRPQFMLDFWMPQGTHIDTTNQAVTGVEQYLLEQEKITHVSSLVGAGGMRFLLTYAPEKTNSSYAQFLVDVAPEDYTAIPGLITDAEAALRLSHPDALVNGKRFLLGPGEGGKIQVRMSGEDPNELRRIEGEVLAILAADPAAKGIRSDWGERVKVLNVDLADEEASRAGITREGVADAVKAGFDGVTIGVFREGDELLPILFRAPAEERGDVSSINDRQIWSPAAGRSIPLRQVVSGFETGFEDDMVWRRDRKRTITVHADPASGPASTVFARIRPQIEALELPTGYVIEWGGEYESSGDAQAALAGSIPLFVLLMFLIVVVLFNSLRQPTMIFLCVPLALIGVAGGLLLTGQPFGFMALLGFLSLMGMLIKNAIVLIDEIELQKRGDKSEFQAIMDSGVSRLRPVAMAAVTTALGMIPLLPDAFFVAMAVTIIGGLVVATVLTMVLVPVLYAIFFSVPSES
ncbi:MAG: efflux RND transporter permease subunit [bacterium]|nr:efflux RND transporter permease subunit [bacterium]